MAEIPSDIASSAAGSPLSAREVAKAREARRAGQAHTAERQVKTVDEAGATVDTEEGDTQVFTDAEGAGSQGRALDESEIDGSPGDTGDEATSTGITTDAEGQTHLDLEA